MKEQKRSLLIGVRDRLGMYGQIVNYLATSVLRRLRRTGPPQAEGSQYAGAQARVPDPCAPTGQVPRRRRPVNLILIVSDTFRYDHIGANGNPVISARRAG